MRFKFDRTHYMKHGASAHVTLTEYVMLDGYLYEKVYFWYRIPNFPPSKKVYRYNLFPVFA